jgi:hypothetical protein
LEVIMGWRWRIGAVFFLALGGCHTNPGDLVGGPCTTNGDCQELCAISSGHFPDGFCTVACFDDGDCPSDTVCADLEHGICLFACDSDLFCRDLMDDTSYECRDADTPEGGTVLVCLGN